MSDRLVDAETVRMDRLTLGRMMVGGLTLEGVRTRSLVIKKEDIPSEGMLISEMGAQGKERCVLHGYLGTVGCLLTYPSHSCISPHLRIPSRSF